MSYDPASEGHPVEAMFGDVDMDTERVYGYFSFKAKVYLVSGLNMESAEIMFNKLFRRTFSDHMDFAITSLEMFSGISENLLNYAFNVRAHYYSELSYLTSE